MEDKGKKIGIIVIIVVLIIVGAIAIGSAIINKNQAEKNIQNTVEDENKEDEILDEIEQVPVTR